MTSLTDLVELRKSLELEGGGELISFCDRTSKFFTIGEIERMRGAESNGGSRNGESGGGKGKSCS